MTFAQWRSARKGGGLLKASTGQRSSSRRIVERGFECRRGNGTSHLNGDQVPARIQIDHLSGRLLSERRAYRQNSQRSYEREPREVRNAFLHR